MTTEEGKIELVLDAGLYQQLISDSEELGTGLTPEETLQEIFTMFYRPWREVKAAGNTAYKQQREVLTRR